jgi:hypothetical protein
MRYCTIILLACLLASCGKSPLFNKVSKSTGEITGNILLSENFPIKNINFYFKWKIPPSLEELGVFEIELEKPLTPNFSINAFIWMPEMGHGSSPIEVMKSSDLNYIFSEVAFIMPGLWVLHIEIIENNIVVDKWQKSIVL